MKIAVELRTVTFGETGGITQWLHGTLRQLVRSDLDNQYLILGLPYNYHLIDFDSPNLTRATFSTADDLYDKGLKGRLEYERDVEVLLRPYPFADKLDFPLHRQVVCFPDLRHGHFSSDFVGDVPLERRRTARVYQAQAGALATFSEAARQRLLDDPWTTCRDVFHAPPALPDSFARPEDDETGDEVQSLAPDAPYFLYPANLWPHKNHAALLEAFARFHKARPDVHLVLTGHSDGWAALKEKYKRFPVKHLGYVSPRLLAGLYRRALALVYPSLDESVGLPLLEAFASGVPVLCSPEACLREVGGDAVLTCDPTDPDALCDGMTLLAQDEALRRQLIERGRARLPLFTWERSAAALRGALARVAARAREGTWLPVAPPPLVSIVTPSYNQGKFIRTTIESVLGQDYPHVDFRVVDGGSNDETLDVLHSYGDRFPWTSEKDRGQTHAINKGLALAKGQILSYLNSDDILRPGAISRVVKHFQQRPACDLVYGRDAYVDAEGRYLDWFPTKEYSFETLIDNCCVSQPAAFWRDRIMKAAGLFDESLYSIMDYEYWMRLDRAGANIEYLPELLASTRIHNEAKTSGGKDYQTRRFFEMVRSSGKHAGYVSRANVEGWMLECVYPRYPILKSFPNLTYEAVGGWFHLRYVKNCRPVGAAARTVEHVLFSLMGLRNFSLFTHIREKFRSRKDDDKSHSPHSSVPPSPPRLPSELWGPRLHNMLGPRVVVGANVDRGDDELKLAGMPVCDLTLTLTVGGKQLASVPLKARQFAEVRVTCPRVKDDPRLITVEFSDSVRCPVRGEFAFELLGTNLFGERYYV